MFQLHHLCNIGGSSVEAITRRFLKHCIVNSLAMQCNFVGKGQTFTFGDKNEGDLTQRVVFTVLLIGHFFNFP